MMRSISLWLILAINYSHVHSLIYRFRRSESRNPSDSFEQLEIESPFSAGDWGKVDMCPTGQFVSGFSVEYQPFKGSDTSVGKVFAGIFSFGIYNAVSGLSRESDDNGLTGVYLYCTATPSDLNSKQIISSLTNENTPHHSKRHQDVKRTSPLFCQHSFATGFTPYMQPSQGTNDDAGITNFRLNCGDGQKLKNNLHYDPGEELKGPPLFCSSGTAICGLQTKVEFTHYDDNTGLNDIKIHCCKLPPPTDESKTCIPRESWSTVTSFGNKGNTPSTHQFQIRVGLSNTKENRQLDRNSKTNTNEFGFGQEVGAVYGATEQQKVTLALRFDQKFGTSSTNGREHESKTIESLETVHTITQTAEVGPKTILKVKQKIRSCGPFQINTVETVRVDECMEGYQKICDAFNAVNKFGKGG